MAAGSPIYLYDRVEIFLDNIPYLPNGMIRSFSMTVNYNSTLNQGFSPTGLASGITVGNKSISNVGWGEYLQSLTGFINLRTFFLANPNAIMTVVPVTLATGQANAPQFTITGVVPTSINIDATQEGAPMNRNCTFIAVDSSNT